MITTIRKWEDDPAIKIPKELLAALHWHEGAELNIYVKGGKIILELSKCEKTITRQDALSLFLCFVSP